MVLVGQGEQRTVSLAQLAELYRQGVVHDNSYVWRDGMGDWKPISAVPEVKAAMPAEEEPQEVSVLESSTGAREIDDMPTTMLQSPMAAVPRPPAPAPAPAPAPIIPQAPPSASAARRPGPERPDLLATAQASDKGLAQVSAQATGQPIPAQAQAPQMGLQNQGGKLVFPGVKSESSMINLPTAFFMAQLNSPGRKKKLFAVAGGGAVGLLIGAVLVVRTFDEKEKMAVQQGWSSLHACLLGEPLKEREGVGERIRNIQLSVVGTPVERRSKPGEQPWPLRCAAVAHDLAEHAKAAGGEYAPLQASAEALSKALVTDSSATSTFHEQAEKLWADGGKARLAAGKSTSPVPAAPKAAAALGYEAFTALPKFLSGAFSATSVRPAAHEATSAFVIDQQDLPEGPHVCVASSSGNATCSKVAAAARKLSPGLRLLGHVEEGAKPWLFAGDHGQSGVLRPDTGEPATSAFVLGARSARDGSLWALTRGGARDAKLVYVSPSGAKTERPGPQSLGGDALASAGLVGGWIAYRTGPQPSSRLSFRKLPDRNGEPGAAQEAGDIDEALPGDAPADPVRRPGKKAPPPSPEAEDERAVATCAAGETLAVRFRGQKGDAVSLLQAGKWSPPIKSASAGGLFTCRKGEATSVKVTPVMEQDKNWASISHVACNLAGCKATTVSMKDLLPGLVEAAPIDGKSALAVDVDGKLLVVWNAGYVGGIRMRMAPPGQIKEAEDVVLVDARDPKNAMKLTAITELKLVPAGTSALLFLGGPTGTRALRIDASGASTPLQATVQ
ncbi:MAG: DUF4339 domain-containing protein [Polyangiaceae bacterium]|jgi:hypothetical protein|nr:DUF4339 domain-containing protein [Polyangiaceae bacterium]